MDSKLKSVIVGIHLVLISAISGSVSVAILLVNSFGFLGLTMVGTAFILRAHFLKF